MAKGKKKVNKKNSKKVVVEEVNIKDEARRMITVTCIVVILLTLFYILTVKIVNKNNGTSNNTDTTIQHEDILAGSSFSMKEDEYLVLFYDKSSEDVSDISTAVYTYRNLKANHALYTVDMSDGFNKGYVGDKANPKATKAEELKINGPTLIKFNDNKISEYIEGNDKIVSYLS